jgi:hypothetical protein
MAADSIISLAFSALIDLSYPLFWLNNSLFVIIVTAHWCLLL